MRTGPVDQNVESLKQLSTLLNDVLRDPRKYTADSALLTALKSQQGLAKYASTERRITPSSLNTQKRLSASILDEGYSGLDRLRCSANDRLRNVALSDLEEKKNSRSVAGLSDEVAELKRRLSIASQDCAHLSTAFARALSAADNLAQESGDVALQARWHKTRRQLLSIITLTRGSHCSNALTSKAGLGG